MEFIKLKNIRNFTDISLPISKWTVLTGENGLGKSTIIEAIKHLKTFSNLDLTNDKWASTIFHATQRPAVIFHTFSHHDGKADPKKYTGFEYLKYKQSKDGKKMWIENYTTFWGDKIITFSNNQTEVKFAYKEDFFHWEKEINTIDDFNLLFKKVESYIASAKFENIPLFYEIAQTDTTITKLLSSFLEIYNIMQSDTESGTKNFLMITDLWKKSLELPLEKKNITDSQSRLDWIFAKINELPDATRQVFFQLLNSFFSRSDGAIRIYSLDNDKFYVFPGLRNFSDLINIRKPVNEIEELISSREPASMEKVFNEFLKVARVDHFKISVNTTESSTKEKYLSILANFNNGNIVNINNVGQGYAQVFPLLLGSKNNILVFKQPEVHLHPSLSAAFATSVMRDKSFIIETHSKELVDRLRIVYSTKENRVDDKLIINTFFVSKDNNISVESIIVNHDGRIPNANKYLEFFEDEMEKWF